MYRTSISLLLGFTLAPAAIAEPISHYIRQGLAEDKQPSPSRSLLPISNASKTFPAYQPTVSPMFQLSSDPEFAFYLAETLSLSEGGGANTGEVLRIATQVLPSDFESVYTAFNYLAEHVHTIADGINVTQDPIGAREAYYRAATYYRGADFYLIGDWNDPRNYDLWNKALDCYNKAMALMEPFPGERFRLKAHSPNVGDFEVPGIFYKAKAGDEATPTVVIGSGYDGSQEELYHAFVRDILARGLNVVTYEGPGQPTVIREQNLGFIPDWWNVVTPVVDYISTRQDVDMSKLALAGISFGGQLAPRAASREHRFSALIAIDGLASMREAIASQLPPQLLQLYASGNKTAFDDALISIAHNTSQSTKFRYFILQSLWCFHTHSPYEFWTREFALDWTADLVKNITMPTFVAKGEDDGLVGSQATVAFHMLVNDRANGKDLTTFHEFPSALGAGEHCAIGAESYQAQVVMKWLGDLWNIRFENNMT